MIPATAQTEGALDPAARARAECERLHAQMSVRFGVVPDTVADPVFQEPDFVMSRTAFRFETPGGALFHYALGEGIRAHRPGRELEDEFRLYLWGTVFGVVAWLNGFFPLHASAVEMDGRVVAFTADSGQGKSTLAAGLAAEGFAHLTDDTLPLIVSGDAVYAIPDRKPLKLWDDAFERVRVKRGEPITSMPGKHYAEPLAKRDAPLPLTDLVLLEFGDETALTPIEGATKLTVLAEAMYREFVPVALGDRDRHAAWMVAIAGRLKVWRLTRPRSRSAASSLSATIRFIADAMR